MLRKVLTLVVVGAVASAGLVASGSREVTAARSAVIDVLFVGNSLIGTRTRGGEDTPDVVRRMAGARGRTVRVTKAIRYGSTLQKSWDTGLSRRPLTAGRRYDFILLQEFSVLVASDPARVRRTLLDTYTPALARSLKPGGKVILFKNWALVPHKGFPSRAANVAAIDRNYERLARDLPLPVVLAPISDGFEKVVARRGTTPLIVKDGKHPTSQAIYLDAAILYGMFYGEAPDDVPNLFLKPATARYLRGAATQALAA
ncbi:hypothetical protein AB0M54_36865 [Actinoplanes sp. NPDC051470]|uniref:hypothetical protein n=1 Tax=unclassified Actinoplanes TaxID=2626549 RepID=UPI00341A333F